MKLFLLLFFSFLCAAEPLPPPAKSKPKRYTLSVCALFKNESRYLKEWIEYHKLIGVDHFYLYEGGSIDGFKRILQPYINARLVTLIPWPDGTRLMLDDEELWTLSTQITAYENAAKWKALLETQWLLFLDIDEFLVPCFEGNMREMLKQHEQEPALLLDMECYDASNRSTLPARKLVIETTEITALPPLKPRRAIEKAIFKPDLCISSTWPPYHNQYKEGKQGLKMSRELIRVNRYENRAQYQRANSKPQLHLDHKITESEKLELLKMGYEIEDQEKAIYRFLPNLYKQLNIP